MSPSSRLGDGMNWDSNLKRDIGPADSVSGLAVFDFPLLYKYFLFIFLSFF